MRKAAWSIFIAALLAACSQQGGEYVGTWRNVKTASNVIVIERNDDALNGSFLVHQTIAHPNRQPQTDLMPATIHNGVLEIQSVFGTSTLTIAKNSGRLLLPSMGGTAEYERVK